MLGDCVAGFHGPVECESRDHQYHFWRIIEFFEPEYRILSDANILGPRRRYRTCNWRCSRVSGTTIPFPVWRK